MDVTNETGALLGGSETETSVSENTTTQETEAPDNTEAQQTSEADATQEQQTKQESNNSVPEAYSIESIELPEGVELDSKLIEEFSPVAKEAQLSQAQYETLCKHYAQIESNRADKINQFFNDRDVAWMEEMKKDPEFGGENINATSQLANRVLKRFDTDGSYTDHLRTSRDTNNPFLTRVLARIGRVMSEDTLNQVTPNGGKKGHVEPHEAMGWKSLKEMGVD